jgi:hypothetical protein
MPPSFSSECRGISSRPTNRGDSAGAAIDFILSGLRNADAAKRTVSQCAKGSFPSAGCDQYRPGTNLQLRHSRHKECWDTVTSLPTSGRAVPEQYLGAGGFREFLAARRTIQGYEAIHILRRGQIRRSQRFRMSDGSIDSGRYSLSSRLKLSTDPRIPPSHQEARERPTGTPSNVQRCPCGPLRLKIASSMSRCISLRQFRCSLAVFSQPLRIGV